ncbi:MAG: hypothetical protein OHK0036_13930 [Bacteroidia bacterium]
MYKKIFIYLYSSINILILGQNSFEGKIEFLYYKNDTTKNVYLVKEPFVRLDQYSKNNTGSIEGSYLFNLNTKQIQILSHKRKMWSIHKSSVPPVIKGECEIIKTSNTKKILNIPCTEYIVRNKQEDIEISYWISNSGNYTFFQPLLALWNRKDKQSVYFLKITDLKLGMMPLLSVEKQISTGKIISKLETIKIEKVKLKDDDFIIPKDYKKFEE